MKRRKLNPAKASRLLRHMKMDQTRSIEDNNLKRDFEIERLEKLATKKGKN